MWGSHHGKLLGNHFARGARRVDRARVDVDQRVAAGESLIRPRQVVIGSQQIHEIARVGWVEHRQRRGQPERLGVRRDKFVRDGVERAPPELTTGKVAADRGGAGEHVVGGATSEREQQDPRRVDAAVDQLGYPRDEGSRLAGAGARQDD